jgi:hypothetical protein
VSVRDPWEQWEDVLGDLDPETDGELYQAAVDRAMTLEIGLAARCHVALDQVLHGTVTALTGTPMRPNASTPQLIDHIEKAITRTPLPGPATNAKAQEALSAARLANEHRNRVLHDQWMAVFDEQGPRLERIRTDLPGDSISPTRETLGTISAVSEALSAAHFRILGIWLFVGLSRGLLPTEVEDQCANALSLISGVQKSETRTSNPATPPSNPEPPPF